MNPYAKSVFDAVSEKKPKKVSISSSHFYDTVWGFYKKEFTTPEWREPVFPESDDDIIEFFGTVNSNNCCFTDFSTGKKFDIEYPNGGKLWTGSFGMAMCFKRAIDEGMPILDPAHLAGLTEEHARHIFRHKTTPIPMLKERVANLRNVGTVLLKNPGGFTRIFKECDFRFCDIVDRLTEMFESYRDESLYGGRLVLFNKRAQLFPMVYHGRALSSQGRLQPIRDPENFGPITDCEVPKALRMAGILRYSAELNRMIDEGQVIPKDSEIEVEIRAQTVVAMQNLLEETNRCRRRWGSNEITMAELDYTVWSLGRLSGAVSMPHHYTYTMAY